VRGNLVAFFIRVEILVGLVGGASAMLLFLAFEHMHGFRVLLYGLVGVIGILVGCELPILMRILKDELPFKDLVSRVFTVDYVGALLASVLFPLVLAPRLGLMRTAFLFGILNVGAALVRLQRGLDPSPGRAGGGRVGSARRRVRLLRSLDELCGSRCLP
jgi:spermidine synthase